VQCVIGTTPQSRDLGRAQRSQVYLARLLAFCLCRVDAGSMCGQETLVTHL